MKHAGTAALNEIASLLRWLREEEFLVERSPGAFYLKSKAFLHFHEDPAGLFADVKLDRTNFERFPVTTKDEQRRFCALVTASLGKDGRDV